MGTALVTLAGRAPRVAAAPKGFEHCSQAPQEGHTNDRPHPRVPEDLGNKREQLCQLLVRVRQFASVFLFVLEESPVSVTCGAMERLRIMSIFSPKVAA